MTLYAATATAGLGILALLTILLAIPVAWSAVHVTRWALDHIHGWVLSSIVAPHTHDEPASALDELDWIAQWEASRTPEATQARMAQRVGGQR
jgi:hypothetical protein